MGQAAQRNLQLILARLVADQLAGEGQAEHAAEHAGRGDTHHTGWLFAQQTLRGGLSEYRVYEHIADGGFASVWIGRDTTTNVPVAVKRLHPHLKSQPEIMMRFTVLGLRDLGMKEEDIYISMERNMRCGLGWCGHCQLGPTLICRDGPIYRYDQVSALLALREV